MTFDLLDPGMLMPIGPAEIPARLVCVGQRNADRLRAWMGEVFECIDVQEYKLGQPVSPVLLDARFGLIVMAGHDPRRLITILRNHEPALRSPIVVAAMTGSTPQSRAAMLRAGFDDVLDIDRMHGLEAIVRIRAMWRRKHATAAHVREMQQQIARVEQVCPDSALTAREKRLIECLPDKPGWCVPAERLRRIASTNGDPISAINLRVSLSKLRRKMTAGAWIKALPQEGYMLVCERRTALMR